MGSAVRTVLVGCTGFVGSNLADQYRFEGLYHSRNIAEAFGSRPDVCFYAGVPAQKFLANRAPEEDKRTILTAMENIRKINPARLVLISTIDVFPDPVGVDETAGIETAGLQPYGLHRYMLEEWARENVRDCCIVRLPALFGRNLKKNFLFDLIHVIPTMLTKEKYEALRARDSFLEQHYHLADNGMYVCGALSEEQRKALRAYFERVGFSAAYFTDSRARFPFYNLDCLRRHIDLALEEEIDLLHCAVEPIRADEIYRAVTGKDFVNEKDAAPPHYDFRTAYARRLGGRDGYLFDKERVLADILAFVEASKEK